MKSVLVLMSTYNGEKYIYEQIRSIMSQKNVIVKLLIRDDSSSDNTINILKTITNPDIEILYGENRGFAESFSLLLKEAQKRPLFDYYAFADQDDVWLPNKLYEAVKKISKIEEKNKPCGYSSNCTLVNSELNFLKLMHNHELNITKERALLQNVATGCTMVFNYTAIKLYVENRPSKIMVHDYLMYLICVFIGNFIYDNNSYIYYRQHSNNQIGSKNILKRFIRRIEKFGKSDNYFLNHNLNFLESYKNFLSTNDILKITYLCNYKMNFASRLSLIFNKKYKYDTIEFNFFMLIKILFGKL